MSGWAEALLIGACLLGVAVFSGSETASYTISRVRVDLEARQRSLRSRLSRTLLADPTTLLIVVLVGSMLLVELATWVAEDGIRYVRPEIALLYKARLDREKDRRDLELTWPLLDDAARAWLLDAVGAVEPGHAWLTRLASGGGSAVGATVGRRTCSHQALRRSASPAHAAPARASRR